MECGGETIPGLLFGGLCTRYKEDHVLMAMEWCEWGVKISVAKSGNT